MVVPWPGTGQTPGASPTQGGGVHGCFACPPPQTDPPVNQPWGSRASPAPAPSPSPAWRGPCAPQPHRGPHLRELPRGEGCRGQSPPLGKGHWGWGPPLGEGDQGWGEGHQGWSPLRGEGHSVSRSTRVRGPPLGEGDGVRLWVKVTGVGAHLWVRGFGGLHTWLPQLGPAPHGSRATDAISSSPRAAFSPGRAQPRL